MIQWNQVTWYSKLLAIIFFIGVLPVLCFYVGKEYEEVKKEVEVQSVIVTPPASAVAVAATSTIDASDWKTYKNEEYGFEIKYPSDYEPKARHDGIIFFKILPDSYYEGGGDGSAPNVSLVVMPVGDKDLKTIITEKDYSIVNENPVLLNHLSGTEKLEFEFESNFSNPHGYAFRTGKYDVIIYSWHGLESEDEAVLESMIPTLKFLPI